MGLCMIAMCLANSNSIYIVLLTSPFGINTTGLLVETSQALLASLSQRTTTDVTVSSELEGQAAMLVSGCGNLEASTALARSASLRLLTALKKQDHDLKRISRVKLSCECPCKKLQGSRSRDQAAGGLHRYVSVARTRHRTAKRLHGHLSAARLRAMPRLPLLVRL